jgi:hypothetical protein
MRASRYFCTLKSYCTFCIETKEEPLLVSELDVSRAKASISWMMGRLLRRTRYVFLMDE